MKEYKIDIPLNARCVLRLTKSTPFHTKNGNPNNYDWKHSRIQFVFDNDPIKVTVHREPIEMGDKIPIDFEINGQDFTKVLVNVKDSIFTVETSEEAKRVIREVQNKYM